MADRDLAEIEVWACVDADGDYRVGEDRETAVECYEENIGSAAGCRLVKIKMRVALPEPIEVDVTIPDEAGEIVAEAAE